MYSVHLPQHMFMETFPRTQWKTQWCIKPSAVSPRAYSLTGRTPVPEMWLFMLHFGIRAGSQMISYMWRGSWTSQPQRRMLTKWQKCFTSVSSKLVSDLCIFYIHTPHCDIFHLTQSPFLNLAPYPCSRCWRLFQLWGVATCKSNVFPTLSVKNTSEGLISQMACRGPTMLESAKENLLWPPYSTNILSSAWRPLTH